MSRRRFVVEIAATTAVFGLGCKTTRRRSASDVRRVALIVPAVPTREGAGVSLRRALGSRDLPMLDPFLLLDEIHSDRQQDWIAGFPTHPHRGFETVSYLIDGTFEHADSVGNRGTIGPGDVQWMTAGRGIVHSEMPRQEPGKDLWGLQLWVNLPAKHKMIAPRYQELSSSAIRNIEVGDAAVRLVAGSAGNAVGPIDGVTAAPTLLDATVPAGGLFRHALAASHNAFAYVLAGAVQFGAPATTVAAGELAVLESGREVAASSETGGRFLLLSAEPIGEPVARRGPFVMNTDAQLRQAFDDYRGGTLAQPI
jgi:hypothetical protein